MVIKDLTKEAVVKGIKEHLQFVESKRTVERYKMLNYYEGLVSELEADINKWFNADSLKQAPPVVTNLTGKMVDSRAISYKQAPQRMVDERYEEIAWNLDSRMLQLERLTYLLGTMGLKTFYNEEKQRIEYDLLVEFYPMFLPNSSEPVAVAYPLFSHGNSKMQEQVYVFWSAEEHYNITQRGKVISVNDEDVNPYGVMPITFAHRHPLTTDWWREGASDIVSVNTTVNILLTEMSLGMRLEMLGQPWVSGIDDASRMQLGVDKPLILPEGASFQFATAGGNLTQYSDAIRFMIDKVAYENSLKTKWAVGRDAVSGEALKMLEVDLTEAVMTDVEMVWRDFERTRYEVDRAVLDYHNVSLNEDFSVDFSEPRFPLSATEERAQWEWEWQHGLRSKKDWFRKNNPDSTDIDALVETVQAERAGETTAEQPATEGNLLLQALQQPV